jgi:hypothetical protein
MALTQPDRLQAAGAGPVRRTPRIASDGGFHRAGPASSINLFCLRATPPAISAGEVIVAF